LKKAFTESYLQISKRESQNFLIKVYDMKKPQIIVIVGPNASGKSRLGVKVARKVNGEIISADSRQVYKGLDIGSGKITKKEMRGVPHRCIDIADPKKVFTAYDYQKCARSAILDILSRGKTPIIVGGTGFYIDAALERVKLGGVSPNHALRKKLTNYSTIKLLNYLTRLDPKRAKTIEQKNPRRIIRAIEIASVKRALKSETKFKTQYVLNLVSDILWLGIKRKPNELKKRIHKRLTARLPGIIHEVKKLKQEGLSWKRLYDLGLEYRYASLYLRGKISKEEMIRSIEQESWKYAKRQMTWFKKNKEIKWISSPQKILKLLF